MPARCRLMQHFFEHVSLEQVSACCEVCAYLSTFDRLLFVCFLRMVYLSLFQCRCWLLVFSVCRARPTASAGLQPCSPELWSPTGASIHPFISR